MEAIIGETSGIPRSITWRHACMGLPPQGQPRKVAKLLVGGAQAVVPATPALAVIVRVKLFLQVDLATLLAVLLTLTAGQSGCRRLKVLPPSPPPSLQGEEA